MRRLILRSFQSPGDILMLTAAVRELHLACPGRFQTDVRTSATALWENNPYLTPLREGEPGVEVLDMHYPAVHQSNQRPYHFLHGYAQYLEERLGVRLPVSRFQGDIHLSPAEKTVPPAEGLPESFWIVIAGGKYDFTAKWWDPARYQAAVDHFRGRVAFVQCGEAGHWHPRLRGVVDLVGKTTTRDFVRLMHHADGVLCPVTFAMHLAAAVETRPGRPRHRACVVVAGGREPPHWESYPQHQFLSTVGALPCCADGGCWRSRCQLVGDGDPKDRRDLCELPVQITPDLRIPRCLDLLTVEDVVRRIELYYHGGALHFAENATPTPIMATTTSPTQAPASPKPATNILIIFRHGLGDAVQLTVVLRHLRRHRPDWAVDVAALVGKHSAFHGLCRRVFVLDREPLPRAHYQRAFDLAWPECATCYTGRPATKAERCLLEVFGLTPDPTLCTYHLERSARAVELARHYLEDTCGVAAAPDGRYPVVLIHYEGNTAAGAKNLPLELVRRLCADVLETGAVPIILDWDRRTPLADSHRIHNPDIDCSLWGGIGTGDAEVLAALIDLAALMIGVDSGPLHVAGATATPTLGVWTGHHPLHYFAPADHVTHLIPHDHARLLRGDRAAGEAYFNAHYRYRTYRQLETALRSAVRERLCSNDGLSHTRGFWIRADNAAQDLVIVEDVAEQDCYRVDELPVPQRVVDVGAHIGCFSVRVHRRSPLARIVAVECCPENVPALRKNVAAFATVVPAALTYERDMVLLNAVFPDCASTGGSALITRAELARRIATGEVRREQHGPAKADYWADYRPLPTVTLEDVAERHGLEHIDVLKLDCEGSEFSILRHTTLLDRIGAIVGEYHGKAAFLELVRERFAGWELRILRDGDVGLFWLLNPRSAP